MDNTKAENRDDGQPLPLGDISRNSFSMATIRVRTGTAEELDNILTQKVDVSAEVYRNTPMVLNIEEVSAFYSIDYASLQQICRKHEVFLIGVTGVTDEKKAAELSERNIPIVNSSKYSRILKENMKPKIVTQTVEMKVPIKVEVPVEVRVPVERKVPEPIHIVRRNIRSGETVNGQNCSLVIFGSVGFMSRIVATHHIFVFGDVNGASLSAGAPADQQDPGLTDSVIYVQGNFNPGILSIAGNYKTAEDLERDDRLAALKDKNDGITVSIEDNNFIFGSLADIRTLNRHNNQL